MDFLTIVQTWFALLRGQASALPTFDGGNNRDYQWAIVAARASIAKWDRADGELWRELITTAQIQSVAGTAGAVTVTSNVFTYAAMANMRKPPAFVRFYNGNSFNDIQTIPPQDALKYSDLSGYVWFSGGANTGYKLNIGRSIAAQYASQSIDYVYIKKPVMPVIGGPDPSGLIVDMSDPFFIVQDMLAASSSNARNGFVYKTASKDAQTALMNMKIEDGSGTYGNASRNPLDTGWGVNDFDASIKL